MKEKSSTNENEQRVMRSNTSSSSGNRHHPYADKNNSAKSAEPKVEKSDPPVSSSEPLYIDLNADDE